MIDCTYNFDKNQYKLCGFVYLDCDTNSSKLAAVGYMDVENEENLTFLFTQLKEISNSGDNLLFMTDKDFKAMRSLRQVFTHSKILLCLFHVLQYMRTIIASACNCTVNVKNSLSTSFSKLVYSKSSEEFSLRNAAFKNEGEGVLVLPPGNQDYVELPSYYTRNWENCAEMWAIYLRSDLTTLSDNTNNRVERFVLK